MIERRCEICGKKINTYPSIVKIGKAKYCSNKCYGKWRVGRFVGPENGAWTGGEVNRECEVCGKKFTKKRFAVRDGGGRFCSYSCMGKWMSDERTGEMSANWKGGIDSQNRAIRTTYRYKMWRIKVLTRDGYICPCGSKENLEVHHIKPLYEIIKESNLHKIPIHKHPTIWDIDNGKTLCDKCHNKTKKGRIKNGNVHKSNKAKK